jgi:plastocyanin
LRKQLITIVTVFNALARAFTRTHARWGNISGHHPERCASTGNRAFMPDDLDITVGTTVTWTNSDSVAHTSTSNGSGWDSGTIAPGRGFSFTFQTAGTFPYHCTIHPGMVGSVVVR